MNVVSGITNMALFTRLSLKKATLLFTFVVVFFVVCELIAIQRRLCNKQDSVRHIHGLCSNYHDGVIVGSMCSKLCDKSVFRWERCSNSKGTKKQVLMLTCDGCIEPGQTSTVVVKFLYGMIDFQDVPRGREVMASETPEEKVALAKEFIRSRAKQRYKTDFSEHEDLLSFIIGADFKPEIDKPTSSNSIDAVVRTAMSLTWQTEFLSYKFLGSKPFMPKLYGTCGQAYFLENTPSLTSTGYIYFSGKVSDTLAMEFRSLSWSDRARAALTMLDMIRDIEDSYGPAIQFCDGMAFNFGVSNKGNVVILDSDSLLLGPANDTRPCNTDSDCAVHYCRWKCNQTTHLCEKEMISSNLQMVCQNVFISLWERFGMLRGAPSSIKERMWELLNQCKRPLVKGLKLPGENRSDRQTIRELERLLKSSL